MKKVEDELALMKSLLKKIEAAVLSDEMARTVENRACVEADMIAEEPDATFVT